jgi:peptidoglycan hydrolase-like protein with peptidoglycan-binding domain
MSFATGFSVGFSSSFAGLGNLAGGVTRELRRGMQGEDVRELQYKLNLSDYTSELIIADGIFGPLTERMVREFQTAMYMTPTGVADRTTLEHMGLWGNGGGAGTGGSGTGSTGGGNSPSGIPSGAFVKFGADYSNYWTSTARSTTDMKNDLVRALANDFTYVTVIRSSSDAASASFDIEMRTAKSYGSANGIEADIRAAADRANLYVYNIRFFETGSNVTTSERRENESGGGDPNSKSLLESLQEFFDKGFLGGAITGGGLVVIGVLLYVLKNK